MGKRAKLACDRSGVELLAVYRRPVLGRCSSSRNSAGKVSSGCSLTTPVASSGRNIEGTMDGPESALAALRARAGPGIVGTVSIDAGAAAATTGKGAGFARGFILLANAERSEKRIGRVKKKSSHCHSRDFIARISLCRCRPAPDLPCAGSLRSRS